MGGAPEASSPDGVPHLWTVEEADRRLPRLRELLEQLKAWTQRLAVVQAELGRLAEFWGGDLRASDHPDHELAERLGRERTNLVARLEESVRSLAGEGIDVKDLETGLVDFYALRGGELVLLCWRLGEAEVGFYHTLEGGFAGRRPLPARVRSTDSPPP